MSEANFPEGCSKTRPVLEDVSNLLGMKVSCSVSKKFDKNSGGGTCENVNQKERGKVGRKDVLLNDKENIKKSRPCIEINSLKENVILSISKIHGESKDPNSVDYGVGNADIQHSAQAFEVPSCEANVSRATSVTDADYASTEIACDSDETRLSFGSFRADDVHPSQNDENDNGADNLIMSQTGSVDGARFPESQESMCAGLKTHENSNLSDTDFIKSCSCSFCRKAAYIWLDLHYQDMKGRITAIRKSQKDASALVERNCKNKATETHIMASSSTESNLEHELRSQWRSLFLHMEKKFEHEANQLESSLLSLRETREKCKTELEIVSGTSTDDPILL